MVQLYSVSRMYSYILQQGKELAKLRWDRITDSKIDDTSSCQDYDLSDLQKGKAELLLL